MAKTASSSFGFVFLHPFIDGNGRINRFLIHQIFSVNGLTPDGFVLPVSAVILSKKSDYFSTLEAFSRPLKAFVSFDPENPSIPAEENDPIYYRYFDATPQSNFLETAVHRMYREESLSVCPGSVVSRERTLTGRPPAGGLSDGSFLTAA